MDVYADMQASGNSELFLVIGVSLVTICFAFLGCSARNRVVRFIGLALFTVSVVIAMFLARGL